MVRDAQADDEAVERDGIGEPNRQRSLRDAARICRHVITGLATSSSAILRDFRIDISEGQDVRFDVCGFAGPRCLSIDLEAQRAQESGLTKVVAGERLVIAAVATRIRDEE